jgi:hypothetical protein
MRYAWVITDDHLATEFGDEPQLTFGPGWNKWDDVEGATDDEVELARNEGVLFRMYDADDELYYTGRLWVEDDSHKGVESREMALNPGDKPFHCVCATSLPEEAFGPLEDFGTPNAGAVTIKYRTKTGRWAVL